MVLRIEWYIMKFLQIEWGGNLSGFKRLRFNMSGFVVRGVIHIVAIV